MVLKLFYLECSSRLKIYPSNILQEHWSPLQDWCWWMLCTSRDCGNTSLPRPAPVRVTSGPQRRRASKYKWCPLRNTSACFTTRIWELLCWPWTIRLVMKFTHKWVVLPSSYLFRYGGHKHTTTYHHGITDCGLLSTGFVYSLFTFYRVQGWAWCLFCPMSVTVWPVWRPRWHRWTWSSLIRDFAVWKSKLRFQSSGSRSL